MGGVPIKFVEAVPFDVQMPGGEVVHMAGGYFPLAYDSTRSVVGDVQANEDAMKVLMATGAGRAATSKGYVKGRAETVKAALNLDYGLVVNRHLDQVITDLSYREAVRDVHMLLNDPRIKNYVSSRLSPSALRSLTGGLAYSVVGSTEAAGNVAKWRALGDGLLANTTVAALALRPDIALGNYGSALVQGIDRSSTSSVLRSFAKFQTHRSELTREIVEKSPFMAAKSITCTRPPSARSAAIDGRERMPVTPA
uniref:VP4 n=1 Tax=Heterorhabditis bacteriophora TaxID=37862 RepID=A0A1I7WDR5_HETBA